MSLVVMGIDPGLANTGWALIECEGSRYRVRSYGCIKTEPGLPLPDRLDAIHSRVRELVEVERPDECAVENVYFSKNVKTAFSTGQARGVAILATAGAGIPVEEYGPGEVKLAVTGNGSAEKSQVAFMVQRLLGISELPKPDHAADALAVAICHANCRGMKRAVAASSDGASR
ncbi:MAG: crossover junction endodeoxyribonuclease RuvC [Coriobacteriia bacterium]